VDAISCVEATGSIIVELPAGFMLDPSLYMKAAEAGLPGAGMYVLGRAGVLGDVDATVVAEAFGMFEPDLVSESWDACTEVMSPAEGARMFSGFAATWASDHLGDGPDYARLGDLAQQSAEGLSSEAPLFVGWRDHPAPDEPKARALHWLNVLREHRGAAHRTALTECGVDPLPAILVHSPHMAPMYGWQEPYPDAEEFRPAWDEAERRTGEQAAEAFASLSDPERDEFAALVAETQASRI
jgi:hypothetical protein